MIKVYWLDLTLQKWRYILQRWRGMGFFSQSTATCNSPTAFLQLMWASAGINICAHVNIPNSGSPTIIWPYGQHCAHWQEWVVLLLWMADWAETKIFFPSGSCCCNCTQLRTPKCPASYEWNILYVNNFQKFKKKKKKEETRLTCTDIERDRSFRTVCRILSSTTLAAKQSKWKNRHGPRLIMEQVV